MGAELILAAVAVVGFIFMLSTALVRPRLLLYLIFALSPTQFLFIPVSSFFISPADVLVSTAAVAFVIRLVSGSRTSRIALWRHRYLLMMLGAYALGYLALNVFSRTIVRLILAITPSILAYEVLRTRLHLSRAAAALVFAGVLDAAYGFGFYLVGKPLFQGRFSGMSGVNFSATVILTAATIMFARTAVTRPWTALAKPGLLTIIGFATLSQGGVLAFLTSWVVVLRRAVNRRNTIRILSAAVLLVACALTSATVRGRLASRDRPTVEVDGVSRTSADVRRMILRVSWQGFVSSPVIGIGYAQFQPLSTTDPIIRNSTGGVGYGTHNTYVEILVEGGLLAFACFILHFSQFLSLGRATLFRLAGNKDTLAASALVGLPLVLVAAALANTLLLYHFWAVCGLGLAFLRFERGHSAFPPSALHSRADLSAAVS